MANWLFEFYKVKNTWLAFKLLIPGIYDFGPETHLRAALLFDMSVALERIFISILSGEE